MFLNQRISQSANAEQGWTLAKKQKKKWIGMRIGSSHCIDGVSAILNDLKELFPLLADNSKMLAKA